jgi:hypothetical protein
MHTVRVWGSLQWQVILQLPGVSGVMVRTFSDELMAYEFASFLNGGDRPRWLDDAGKWK